MRREGRLRALTLGLWLLTGAAIVAPAFWLDFDSDRWLPPEHPQKRALDALRHEFAPGETLAVVLPMPAGAFSAEGVERLLALEEALRAALRDNLVSIRSPASAQRIAADGAMVRVEEFHAAMRRGAFASREDYREAFAESPYGGRLASRDGSLAVLLLRLDTSEQAGRRRLAMQSVRAVLEREGVGGQAHFAGGAALRDTINEKVRRQTLQLAAAGAGVIALFLVLFLRSVRRAFPVLAVALLVIAASMSWIVVLGHKMTVTTLALPILVAIVAVADGLHILAHRDARRRADPLASGVRIARGALGRALRPCLFTSLTTAAGFGAFGTSALIPLRHFGLDSLAAITFAYPVIVLAFWCVFRFSGNAMDPPPSGESRRLRLRTALEACHRLTGARAGRIATLSVASALVLGAGLLHLHTETSFLHVFFKEESTIRKDFGLVDARLGGSAGLDIMLKSGTPEHFKALPGLDAVESMETALAALPPVTYAESYTDPLSRTRHAFTGVRALPDSEDLLAQEILFLELSRTENKDDVLSPHVDFDYATARIHLRLPDLPSRELADFIERVRLVVAPASAGLDPVLTGFAAFVHTMSAQVLRTQAHSLLLTGLAIGLLFVALFGLRQGLAALGVNLLPVVATTGLMAWLGVPFDFSTVLVAGITLGLCVDDTIHLLHAYNRARRTQPSGDARRDAILLTGGPIIVTTLLFCAGFAVLLLSDFVLLVRLAQFTIFGLAASLAASLLLLPAVLTLTERRSGGQGAS